MENELSEMRQMLKELIYELADLKDRVAVLERAQEGGRLTAPAVQPPLIMGESYQSIGRAYKDGYHICPMAFGHLREEEDDCLFCLAVLNRP